MSLPVVAVPATPSAAAAIVPRDDIAALFRAEAQHRPEGRPRVEDVLAAFKTAGARVSALRQHLAKPFGAAYCAGAEAEQDVVLTICEFRSAAEAAAGRAVSLKALASIPNREIALNGSTTLTLRQRKHTPGSQALTGTLERAFAGIKK